MAIDESAVTSVYTGATVNAARSKYTESSTAVERSLTHLVNSGSAAHGRVMI